jgi:tetratricopeptide (TPR) repeat protein
MTEQELHEKIIAYLEGRLSPEAADEFRLQIEADEALAGEVELHRLLQPVGQRLVALDMKAKFDSWQKEAEQPGFVRRNLFWLLAIGLLSAGLLGTWFYYSGQLSKARADNERLNNNLQDTRLKNQVLQSEVERLQQRIADSTWQGRLPVPVKPEKEQKETKISPAPVAVITQPYKQLAQSELTPMITSTRSAVRGGKRSGSTAESLLAKADTAIENRLYRRAEILLLGIAVTDPQYPRALEMLAYTYMMQEKYAAAIETYLKYIPYKADSDETNWHLCLYYLADYPVYRSEFQQLLQTILADTEHFYHDRAKSLRKKLAETGVWPE